MLNFNIFLVFVIFCHDSVYCEVHDKASTVVLPHGGILVGSFMKTVHGRAVEAYRGIPYAEPPVGNLRFKPPVPAKKWQGEIIVDKDASSCPLQNSYERIFKTSGNEDCLYLNVYSPEDADKKKPLSVMVFFHGGGWMTGAGDSQHYGPQRLLDHDVILVSGNYRLGALGFLSTGTKDCPGNNGLKDQLMMLKWVQENIAAFGGNPDDVTIFGESAGGASVGYHMYSPLSKGLFHKAILMSGTNLNEWAFVDTDIAQKRTKEVAKHCGCSIQDENWKEVIDCLRTKSAYEIASVVKELFEYDVDIAVLFPLVVEPEHDGAFMTQHPRSITHPPSGNIPIMIGLTNEDGALKSGPLLHLLKDDFTAKFKEALPILLFYNHLPKENQEKITNAIDEFYFKGKHDWSKENHFNLTNLFTDNWFAWGQDRFLRARFNASENTSLSPTYVYVYDHRGPKSFSENFHSGNEYYGVCHTDELPYLFFYKLPDLGGDSYDDKMKWAMPFMWTSFAKTGNPTPDGSDLPKWLSAEKFPLKYARIGSQSRENYKLLTNEVELWNERIQFWRDVERFYQD